MKMISKAAKYLNRRNMNIEFRTGDIPHNVKHYKGDAVHLMSNRKQRRIQASRARHVKGKTNDDLQTKT